jgi:WD40 repeat protein
MHGTHLDHSDSVYAVAFSYDGSLVASGNSHISVSINGIYNRSIHLMKSVSLQSMIAVGSEDAHVVVWDARTGTVKQMLRGHFAHRDLNKRILSGHSKRVNCVSFNPKNNSIIASCSEDSEVLPAVFPIFTPEFEYNFDKFAFLTSMPFCGPLLLSFM